MKNVKYLAGLTSVLLALFTVYPAAAAKLGIVAVVADQPITHLDITERTKLILRSSGLSNEPEVRNRIAAESLNQLIEEQLQAQEAQRRGISISNDELAQAIAEVEGRNQQSLGSLKNFMLSKGVAWEAFIGQLRAQLLWNKLLGRVVRPKVAISEEEYNRAASNRRFASSAMEYNITPLVLPVKMPEEEIPTRELAQKVVDEVASGASLDAVMQQLMSIPAGNEPRFWVTLDALEPILAEALQQSSKGQLIGPIRTARGYHIMRVNDAREQSNVEVLDPSQVTLKEVLLGLSPSAGEREVQLTTQIAQQVAQNPGTCLDPSVAGISEFGGTDIRVSFLQSTMSDLPAYARQQAKDLAVGQVGEPFATREGIRFYILCEKVSMPVIVKADEKLRERLFREKIELESEKFMRQLKRENYIDIRV